MSQNFFIHSSVNGRLGCFHVPAIINSASVNIRVHASFSIIISLGYMPSSGIIGSYGSFQLWIFTGRTYAEAEAPILDHLMQRADSFGKTLMLGKTEGKRKRRWQRMRCWIASVTQWTWVWANSRRWRRAGKPGVLQSMGLQKLVTN